MVDTDSTAHKIERGAIGFGGSTLVVLPAFSNWLDTVFLNVPVGHIVKAVEYSTGFILLICWFLAIWVVMREPKISLWACFFEGVGVPGSIFSAGSVFQVVVN